MKKSRIISVRSIKQMIRAASATIREDRIRIYAASASFFIIISFIPFIMLLVTAAGLVLSDNDVKQVERLILLLPEAPAKFILDEFQFLTDQKPAVPLSLTTLALFWTASRGMLAVRGGVKSVFGESSGTFFVERLQGLVITPFFIVRMLALLVFLVFGQTLLSLLGDKLPALQPLLNFIVDISPFIFFLLFILFFAVVFRIFTPRSAQINSLSRHLPGAALAAAGWTLYSFLFSIYIEHFSNMSYVYGSLTTLIVFMLWLHSCMTILLLGAEFNKFLYGSSRRIENIKNQSKKQ